MGRKTEDLLYKNPRGKHSQLDGEGSHYIKNAAEVRQIMQENKSVLAVFQGHNHAGHYSIAVYGTQAVNGVIIIETKGYKAQKLGQ